MNIVANSEVMGSIFMLIFFRSRFSCYGSLKKNRTIASMLTSKYVDENEVQYGLYTKPALYP